jgi:hypothetical protein
MNTISVWLIHHKASLDQHSPMNLDGSTYMVGIGVVPAPDIRAALDAFDVYLQKQDMAALEITKCERYHPANFPPTTTDNREIAEAATDALEEGVVSYVCGISSEALECMEDNGNDE